MSYRRGPSDFRDLAVFENVEFAKSRERREGDRSKRESWRPGRAFENDRVFQYWGCGTQCAELQVRSRDGTSLLQASCAGFDEDDELSSDRRFALCFGDDAAVTVLDVDRGKTLAREPLPCAPGHRDAVKIDASAGKARFTCDDENEKRFAVTVSFGAVQNVSARALP